MRGFKGMLGILGVVAALPLLAQTADDPAIGTWKLNVAKSATPAAMGVKAITRVYSVAADGMHLVETQELQAGGSNTVTYRFRYDGKDGPVTGSSLYDSIAVKETGKGKSLATLKLKGAVVGTNTRAVSADGKSMTTTTAMKLEGKDNKWDSVYDRQ